MEANKRAVLQISTKSVSKREGDQSNSAERREVTTVVCGNVENTTGQQRTRWTGKDESFLFLS